MSNAIAKTPLRQVQDVRALLQNDMARSQLAAVAAKHMSPERLMRVTANAIRTTPKLQQAEPLSFLGALMQCAALGLEPNTVMGHAYLVPFDKSEKGADGRWSKTAQVQLIIGYKGLIDLARRSGHITSIAANIHYSDDELWEYEEGTEARLRHRPGPQDGEKMHAYAIAQFRDGGHAYVVLPWAHVMKIRNGSQGWQAAVKFNKTENSPWFTHEDAMAKKTAIRALAKYLPLSVEFMDAVQVDHDHGAKVDYASYAMNPDQGGPIIDGEVEVEDTPKEDQPEEQTEKPVEEKPAAEKKAAAKTAPKPANDAPPPENLPTDEEMANKVVDLIKSELVEAEDSGTIEAILEMYADQIEPLTEEARSAIHQAADQRREELAA